jgi:hypothetical protein
MDLETNARSEQFRNLFSSITMEVEMRKTILAIMTLGSVAAVMGPMGSAYSQDSVFCDVDHRCLPVSNQAYTACYGLAIQRGWSVMKIDERGRTRFIYDCLRGRTRYSCGSTSDRTSPRWPRVRPAVARGRGAAQL